MKIAVDTGSEARPVFVGVIDSTGTLGEHVLWSREGLAELSLTQVNEPTVTLVCVAPDRGIGAVAVRLDQPATGVQECSTASLSSRTMLVRDRSGSPIPGAIALPTFLSTTRSPRLTAAARDFLQGNFGGLSGSSGELTVRGNPEQLGEYSVSAPGFAPSHIKVVFDTTSAPFQVALAQEAMLSVTGRLPEGFGSSATLRLLAVGKNEVVRTKRLLRENPLEGPVDWYQLKPDVYRLQLVDDRGQFGDREHLVTLAEGQNEVAIEVLSEHAPRGAKYRVGGRDEALTDVRLLELGGSGWREVSLLSSLPEQRTFVFEECQEDVVARVLLGVGWLGPVSCRSGEVVPLASREDALHAGDGLDLSQFQVDAWSVAVDCGGPDYLRLPVGFRNGDTTTLRLDLPAKKRQSCDYTLVVPGFRDIALVAGAQQQVLNGPFEPVPEVHGRVIDRDGIPIEGAVLHLLPAAEVWPFLKEGGGLDNQTRRPAAKSGSEGQWTAEIESFSTDLVFVASKAKDHLPGPLVPSLVGGDSFEYPDLVLGDPPTVEVALQPLNGFVEDGGKLVLLLWSRLTSRCSWTLVEEHQVPGGLEVWEQELPAPSRWLVQVMLENPAGGRSLLASSELYAELGSTNYVVAETESVLVSGILKGAQRGTLTIFAGDGEASASVVDGEFTVPIWRSGTFNASYTPAGSDSPSSWWDLVEFDGGTFELELPTAGAVISLEGMSEDESVFVEAVRFLMKERSGVAHPLLRRVELEAGRAELAIDHLGPGDWTFLARQGQNRTSPVRRLLEPGGSENVTLGFDGERDFEVEVLAAGAVELGGQFFGRIDDEAAFATTIYPSAPLEGGKVSFTLPSGLSAARVVGFIVDQDSRSVTPLEVTQAGRSVASVSLGYGSVELAFPDAQNNRYAHRKVTLVHESGGWIRTARIAWGVTASEGVWSASGLAVGRWLAVPDVILFGEELDVFFGHDQIPRVDGAVAFEVTEDRVTRVEVHLEI